MNSSTRRVAELPRAVRPALMNTPRGPLEYASCGEGPAVLCVHGAMGGYDQSHLLARTLAEPGYRFVCVSRPGYLGTPLSLGRSPEEQADLFAALLDHLGVADAVVMAVSGGGPSALHFALRHPGHCRGLVLVSTCAGIIRERVPFVFWVMNVLLRLPGIAGRLRRQTAADLDRAMRRSIPDAALRARTLADPAVHEMLADLTLGGFDRAAERLPGTRNDIRVTRTTEYPLERIAVPTLIVHGDQDATVPFAAHGQRLAARIPGARLVLAEGGDHVAIFTHREQVRPEVCRFLRETSGPV